MSEREATLVSGVALAFALGAAIWFAQTSWPGAALLGLVFSGWAVMLLVRYARTEEP